MAKEKDFDFKTIKKIGVISESGNKTTELRITSVNGGEEKFDIRPYWTDDKGVEKMGKGIRLTGPELMTLKNIIDKMGEDDEEE